MNKVIVCSVLIVAMMLAPSESQNLRRGRGRGRGGANNVGRAIAARQGQDRAVRENTLQAEERSLDALKALLEKKQARQARLDKKAERKERKKVAQRAAEGERLAAAKSVDYETFNDATEFDNLAAEANKNIENKFALQIASENKHQEAAKIAKNSGSKASTGTTFKEAQAISTEIFAEQDDLFESDFLDTDAINAEQNEENLLNANEETLLENEAKINTRNLDQRRNGFKDNFFNSDDSFFGGRSSFAGSRFGGFNPLFKRK